MMSPDERIVAAAIQYRPKGYRKGSHVCLGKTHAEIIGQFAIMGLKQSDRESGTEIQGFWTSSNRFVNRSEAYYIADAQGQLIDSDLHGHEPYLVSENVQYAAWDGWERGIQRYIPDP